MSFAETYLARAREAEEIAAKVTDPHTRARWLQIAESYRDMARPFGTASIARVSQQQQQPQPKQQPEAAAGTGSEPETGQTDRPNKSED